MRIVSAAALLALSVSAAPAWGANLVETLEGKEQYSTFLKALEASDSKWFVREDVRYTAFVPTNEAFDALPDGVLDALLKEENRPKLDAVLEHHVVPDTVAKAGDLKDGQSLDVAEGESLTVKFDGSVASVDGARVVDPDVTVDQGVAHGIQAVLVPQMVVEALKFRGEYPLGDATATSAKPASNDASDDDADSD